jgi:hypothetical protein
VVWAQATVAYYRWLRMPEQRRLRLGRLLRVRRNDRLYGVVTALRKPTHGYVDAVQNGVIQGTQLFYWGFGPKKIWRHLYAHPNCPGPYPHHLRRWVAQVQKRRKRFAVRRQTAATLWAAAAKFRSPLLRAVAQTRRALGRYGETLGFG